jgi:hypothetical protein
MSHINLIEIKEKVAMVTDCIHAMSWSQYRVHVKGRKILKSHKYVNLFGDSVHEYNSAIKEMELVTMESRINKIIP